MSLELSNHFILTGACHNTCVEFQHAHSLSTADELMDRAMWHDLRPLADYDPFAMFDPKSAQSVGRLELVASLRMHAIESEEEGPSNKPAQQQARRSSLFFKFSHAPPGCPLSGMQSANVIDLHAGSREKQALLAQRRPASAFVSSREGGSALKVTQRLPAARKWVETHMEQRLDVLV
eukprot:510227-Hanusia_phi.AAC.1